ncbi:TPA: hypothetical protein ACXND2_004924 [Pseudomonas aeruginosa]
MADVRPTKLQADGNGYGSLREFADGDSVPVALGGTGAATAAGARASLSALGNDDYPNMPFVNVMPDAGRYAGVVNPLATTFTSAYSNSAFSSGWNGATFTDGGKFTFNNSTNGGSAAALNQRVQDLMAAMGRVGNSARYGVEFFTSLLTAGKQTTTGSTGADGATRYLAMTNNSRAIFCSNRWGTAATWVRVESGTMHVGPTGAPAIFLWVNGVKQSPGYVITPAMGWLHIRVAIQEGLGYNNGFPYFYTTTSAVVAMACPAWFSGLVDTGIHSAPILTINSASSAT